MSMSEVSVVAAASAAAASSSFKTVSSVTSSAEDAADPLLPETSEGYKPDRVKREGGREMVREDLVEFCEMLNRCTE